MEFLIALISILALFAGTLQVSSLARARSDAMLDARMEAGHAAVSPGALPQSGAAFIRDWFEGPDGIRHTADDFFDTGQVASFHSVILDAAAPRPEQWEILDRMQGQGISPLLGAWDPAVSFGMVSGRSRESVPLLPAVRRLLYRADSVEVEATVWMTITGGIF